MFRWFVALAALMLIGLPLMDPTHAAHANEGRGLLNATAHGPLPEARALAIWTSDRSTNSVHLRGIFARELAERRYSTEQDADLTLIFEAGGAFADVGSQKSRDRVELRGEGGSRTKPNLSVGTKFSLSKPTGSKTRKYSLDVRIVDAHGHIVWQAKTVTRGTSEGGIVVAQRLIPVVLDYIGQSVTGHVIR